MAGDWIKVEHVTPDKPEVIQLANLLSIDQDAALGKAIRVWIWTDQNFSSDSELSINSAFIDRLTGCVGFADAMRKVGWLSGRDGALIIPRFDRHNGQTAKSRADTNRRVAEHRQKKNGERIQIPRPIRNAILLRDNRTCVYCGRREGDFTPGAETSSDAVMAIDHVIPVARGGETEIGNLVCSCMACNSFKSDRTPDECGLKWPDVTKEKQIFVTSPLLKPLPEKRREEYPIPPPTRAREPSTIPERSEAIAQAGIAGVVPEFAGYVFDDWSGRGGTDAAGQPRQWLSYVKTRWERERREWTDGTHKGNKSAPAAGQQPAINATARLISLQKAEERITEQIRVVKAGYEAHQSWSKEDIERVKNLKAERDKLRQQIGKIIG